MVQESYLRAFRGLKRFRGDAQFTTWLYRITANCASTHLGRRRRAPPRRARPTTLRSPTSTPTSTRRRGPTRAPPATASTDALARPAAPAAGGGRAARRLRPAPRGDRRRARHLRVGRQGPAAPGPAEAAGAAVPSRGERHEEATHMQCDDVDGAARRRRRRHGDARPTGPPPRRAVPAVPGRSWCSTASCCGRCTTCAPRCSSPPGPAVRHPRHTSRRRASATPSARC